MLFSLGRSCFEIIPVTNYTNACIWRCKGAVPYFYVVSKRCVICKCNPRHYTDCLSKVALLRILHFGQTPDTCFQRVRCLMTSVFLQEMRNLFVAIRPCNPTWFNASCSDFSNKLNSFQNEPCDACDVSADGAKHKLSIAINRNTIKPVFVQTFFQLEFIDRHKRKEKNHDTMHIIFFTNIIKTCKCHM